MMRLISLVPILILTSCIDFGISHEDALDEFEEEDLKPQFDSLIVGNRNIHFAFMDQGRDTIVAFIHGSPGSWNAFIDFFKADSVLTTMDMIAIDRSGFGDSDFGRPEPSLETQALQMNSVLELFPHETKILVGHSLGGPIAARMAMDYPNKYDKIILVAPSIDPDLEKDEWYRGWMETRFGKWILPTDFNVSNEEIIPLKSELENMLDCWQYISARVIVIQGTEDSLVPMENADFAIRMLPDSLLEVKMLVGVNHFIPWTHPEEIIKALY